MVTSELNFDCFFQLVFEELGLLIEVLIIRWHAILMHFAKAALFEQEDEDGNAGGAAEDNPKAAQLGDSDDIGAFPAIGVVPRVKLLFLDGAELLVLLPLGQGTSVAVDRLGRESRGERHGVGELVDNLLQDVEVAELWVVVLYQGNVDDDAVDRLDARIKVTEHLHHRGVAVDRRIVLDELGVWVVIREQCRVLGERPDSRTLADGVVEGLILQFEVA